MKNLIAVEGWATTKESYKGRYRSDHGFGLSGFYRRDYKENHEMVVLSNGHSLCRYKYPRGVNIPFHSPMVNWMNLTFCGGYGVLLEDGEYAGSNKRLFEAVANGLKPIGFINVNFNKFEEIIEEVMQSGFRYEISKVWTGNYEIGLANQGKVKDYFDLDKLINSYRLYSNRIGHNLLTPRDEENLLKINELELAIFLKDFDYASSQKKNWEHVLTGLLLGFPIESTVALLVGQIY